MERLKIFVCVGLEYDADLIPHFVTHYCNLGIDPDNFIVLLNHIDNNIVDSFYSLIKEYGITNIHKWVGEYTSQTMWELRTGIIKEYIKSNEWVIHADIDEFHEYPSDLNTVLVEQEKDGINIIQGVFTDRISNDYTLCEPKDNIWATYPIKCNLNKLWFRPGIDPTTGVVKVMGYKGSLRLNRGGHSIYCGPVKFNGGQCLSKHPNILDTRFRQNYPYQVHHFKWRKSLIRKLQQRVQTYKDKNYTWWPTSQSIIDHCKDGQIPKDMVELYEN